jgi:iron-sulfur cluster repair protein YtfE (RIC family)
MLATEILKQDHRDAMNLIELLENAEDNDADDNRETFGRLRDALMLHMQEEEEIYYPALAALEDFTDDVEDNVADHEMVKDNLAEMSGLEPTSGEFQDLLAETKTAIEMHVTKEEDDIFPESIEQLGEDRIAELGDEIEQLKNEGGMSHSATM